MKNQFYPPASCQETRNHSRFSKEFNLLQATGDTGHGKAEMPEGQGEAPQ